MAQELRPPIVLLPAYSYAEADRLAKVSRGTAKRWLGGYKYRIPGGEFVHRPPVTPRGWPAERGVSFVDLIEVVAIGGLKDRGFALPAIRDIVADCRSVFQTEYPLASHSFLTDGREIFVSYEGRLVGLLGRRWETAWDEVLRPFLDHVDYRDQLAAQWWPLGRQIPIVVDPEFGFGLPVVSGTAIRTEIIAERFEDELEEEIAEDLGVTPMEVQRALQFEISRRPAAA